MCGIMYSRYSRQQLTINLTHPSLPPNTPQCLSSYAFAVTGAVESLLALRTAPNFAPEIVQPYSASPLSSKQLLDCDPDNQGCQGGWSDYSWPYLASNTLADKSSYVAGPGVCHAAVQSVGQGSISDSQYVPPGDEYALKEVGGSQYYRGRYLDERVESALYQYYLNTKNCLHCVCVSGGGFASRCLEPQLAAEGGIVVGMLQQINSSQTQNFLGPTGTFPRNCVHGFLCAHHHQDGHREGLMCFWQPWQRCCLNPEPPVREGLLLETYE